MITHKELIDSREYLIAKIQLDLFAMISEYLKTTNKNKTEFAKDLGVTKGYITQVLNGDFDHKISKWVDLTMAINKKPMVFYVDKGAETDYLELVDSRYKAGSNYIIANLGSPIKNAPKTAPYVMRSNTANIFSFTPSELND